MKKILTLFISVLLVLVSVPVFASAAHHNHIPGKAVVETEKEPTCTESGRYTYNYYCKVCHKFIKSDRVKVDALGHNWEDATCTMPESCTVCGKTRGEALGHTAGESVLEVEWEPTCTESGRYKYNYYCTVCEKFLKFDRVEIDALGHNWTEATCTAPENCTVCGETNGEAPGHVMGEAVLEVEWEPTCTENGRYKYNYYCTVCDKFLKFDRVEVEPIGHNWQEATMMESSKCLNCGKKQGDSLFFQILDEKIDCACNFLNNKIKLISYKLWSCFAAFSK